MWILLQFKEVHRKIWKESDEQTGVTEGED